MPYTNSSELKHDLSNILDFSSEDIRIHDQAAFKNEALDKLIEAVASANNQVRQAAHWVIWSAGQIMGFGPASIQGLYNAMERGDVEDMTVPVVDLEQAPYKIAVASFRAALNVESGAMLFSANNVQNEEQLKDHAAYVMAAAIKENWNTPFFFCFPSLLTSYQDSRFTKQTPAVDVNDYGLEKKIEHSYDNFGIRRSYDVVRRHVMLVRVNWPKPAWM